MKITYIHQYFRTPDMSGGTRSYEMARRLAADGHEVELITLRADADQQELWRVEEIAGVRVHWLRGRYSNRLSYFQRVLAFFHFAWFATWRARRIPADLIFATSTPLTIAIPGVLAARRQRAPMVFEVRDLWPEMPVAMGVLRNPVLIGLARMLERWAYANAAGIVALSPGMADGVAETGYPRERITTVPNSSDLALFDPARAGPSPFPDAVELAIAGKRLVLYPGTLGPVNGVDYLVRVAKASRDMKSNLAFVVIGDGREKEAVRRAAIEAGVLDDTLFLLDPLPKAKMPDAFGRADLIVSLFIALPEMWKNSANKVFDTLAAGKPLAVNYGGWQADLVEQEGVGLLLSAHDPAEAARRLDGFLGDTQAVAAAGAAARRLAEARFSRDGLYQDFHRALRAAVADQANASSDTAPRPAMIRA